MIFSEKTEVIYREMSGVIDFVCDSYVVMQVNSVQSSTSARLLIYRENFKDIEIFKASSK
jgi:hypothetical protein